MNTTTTEREKLARLCLYYVEQAEKLGRRSEPPVVQSMSDEEFQTWKSWLLEESD